MKDSEITIVVPHPEFGEVMFTRLTLRQADILKKYIRMVNAKSIKVQSRKKKMVSS